MNPDPTPRDAEPECHDAEIDQWLTHHCSCGFRAKSGAEMWKHQMAARGVVIADQAHTISSLRKENGRLRAEVASAGLFISGRYQDLLRIQTEALGLARRVSKIIDTPPRMTLEGSNDD